MALTYLINSIANMIPLSSNAETCLLLQLYIIILAPRQETTGDNAEVFLGAFCLSILFPFLSTNEEGALLKCSQLYVKNNSLLELEADSKF